MSKINPVWYRILYSCPHTATVDIKGLNYPGGRRIS